MARQAGIDPVAVRQAALSRLPAPPASLAARLRGGPAVRRHTLQLPGRLPPERRHDLARALDRAVGTQGEVDAGDGAFTWSEDHTQGRTVVRVEPGEAGESVVTVEADRRGWAAAWSLAGLAAGAGVAALVVLPSTGSALGAVAAGAAAWWGLMRLVWPPRSRRTVARLQSAVAAVAAHLEEPGEV